MNEEVQRLINEAIDANPELFLIDWELSASNHIKVVVDGDQGLPMDEVVRISRHIEHNLDREAYDFSLEVGSPGLSRPLEHPRQFRKNLGRLIRIETEQEQYEGEIKEVTEEGVTLHWKTREPKPVGKGKHTVEKTANVAFKDINKALIIVKF